MKKIEVIVLGSNHHNTLGVIRSLGEEGIYPYLILNGDKKSYVSKSRYIKKIWFVSSTSEGLSILLKKEFRTKPILIPCSDAYSSELDLNYNVLSKKYYLSNMLKEGEITRMMDKQVMTNFASSCGMKTLRTWFLECGIIPSDIIYPCITKPLISKSGSKNDIHICKNKLELERCISEYGNNSNMIIQQYLHKKNEYQLIGCSIKGGREVIIPGFTRIIRASETSNTGFLSYEPLQDFPYDVNLCKNFMYKTHYTGLFSMEFIEDENNEIYFMEINFRNDGNSYIVTSSGVNLPFIYSLGFKDSLLVKDPTSIFDKKKKYYMMPELNDLLLFYKGKVPFITWAKDLFRTDCFLEYNKLDKRPFFFLFKNFTFYFLSKIFSKKKRKL